MHIENILIVEEEIKRFLGRLADLKAESNNADRFTTSKNYVYPCKESGAFKRSSLDLTRALAKMRNNIH